MKTPILSLAAALFLAGSMLAPAAAELAVTGGLAPHQVVQCDEAGVAALGCSGTWDGGAAAVQGRVLAKGSPVMDWMDAGRAENGAWEAVIAGVPAGGPYTVEWRAGEDTAAVSPVLVGDLWILAGQSNMQGVGNLDGRVSAPDPRVSMLAMDRSWRLAEEPLHTLPESPDSVHFKEESPEQRAQAIHGHKHGTKGAGLGLPFARAMVERTGRPVGLVCVAHGGTSMEQWDPAKKDEGGASLYGSMLLSLAAAGGKVRGVLWYQGESDARRGPADVFEDKFVEFVEAVRADCGDPNLPFLFVQIGRFVTGGADAGVWHFIRTEQLASEQRLENCLLVSAMDVQLDDPIHAGTGGLARLGVRLANLAERVCFGVDHAVGPRPAAVEREKTRYGDVVRVRFDSVNGGLRAPGRLAGFSISGGDGPDEPCIYNQEIDPEDPASVLLWTSKLPENAQLWYGRGLDPYCNLTDAADMGAPAFGPVPVP
jgi:sialate O-acetylesterase